MEKISNRERISRKLLVGIPRSKPFGQFIDGKFVTGVLSSHRTKQGVAYNSFWRLHRRVGQMKIKTKHFKNMHPLNFEKQYTDEKHTKTMLDASKKYDAVYLATALEETAKFPLHTRAAQELKKLHSENMEMLQVLKYCRQKISYMMTHGEWYSPGRVIEMTDSVIEKVSKRNGF